MRLLLLQNLYRCGFAKTGNYVRPTRVNPVQALGLEAHNAANTPVLWLRSRLGPLSRLCLVEIPGWFSSCLPSLFAPGRFATFLSSGG